MSARRAIVHPPPETGGCLVRINDKGFGTAYSPHGLPLRLQNARLIGRPERDVVESRLIERHEGEPEAWAP
ncbi:hypothetical protein ABZT02_40255 [Streptomyces sp. NPDC005402]|uniref:hypothetical protein n=1 Tax=Streptomyces sp. NPDC005402 TaxID=3155338 RepID=UPI0033BAF043